MLSFVLIISIALLTVFKHNRGELNNKSYLQTEFPLSDFSVIVGEPQSWFEVRSGDSNKIIMKHDGKTDIQTEFHIVKNDTLYISKREKPYIKMKYILQCKSLKEINIMKHSNCYLYGFKAKDLNININGGRLHIGEDQVFKLGKDYWLEIEQLNVNANKGRLYLYKTKIKSANIKLNNATALFSLKTNIKYLNLQLNDSSKVSCSHAASSGNICNTSIVADATSSPIMEKR